NLVIKARSLSDKPKKIQVALIDKNGASFGKILELQTGEQEYSIALSELLPVRTVTLPRPYPSFLPYYFDHEIPGGFKIGAAEAIQISIGPELPEDELKQPQQIGITSLRLEK
ncbi:MAG: hypothetical protein R6W85_00330, partial [Gillisia sp.]